MACPKQASNAVYTLSNIGTWIASVSVLRYGSTVLVGNNMSMPLPTIIIRFVGRTFEASLEWGTVIR